jgi:hypothetical protein
LARLFIVALGKIATPPGAESLSEILEASDDPFIEEG